MRGLYKGKRTDNGEWAYGCYVEAEKLDKSGTEYFIIEKNADGSSHMIIPETLGQWTGLNDKNGTQIFEGDIVKTKFFGKQIGNVVVTDYDKFAVTYETGTFHLENKTRCFPLSYIKEPCSGFEVVGNIYDNPELLEAN